MTMTGVILSIVLSGIVSFFVSAKFLRNRMGLSMAIMFLGPLLSCGVYVYLTAPRFNPPAPLLSDQVLMGQIIGIIENQTGISSAD